VDDKPKQSPVGFLSAREVNSYVMAASTNTYIDLPVDMPIRQLLFQPYSQATDPIALLDTLKLAVDNDRQVILNINAAEYGKLVDSFLPKVHENYTLDAAVTAKTLFVTPSRELSIAIDYDATAFVTAQSKFALPTVTSHKIALAASVDIKGLTALVTGTMPCNSFPVRFGDQYDPDTWLVPPKDGNLKLTVTSSSSAASTATFRTVVQQVRR
jgi:hypothetical protein